jgi:hypothetical protein
VSLAQVASIATHGDHSLIGLLLNLNQPQNIMDVLGIMEPDEHPFAIMVCVALSVVVLDKLRERRLNRLIVQAFLFPKDNEGGNGLFLYVQCKQGFPAAPKFELIDPIKDDMRHIMRINITHNPLQNVKCFLTQTTSPGLNGAFQHRPLTSHLPK